MNLGAPEHAPPDEQRGPYVLPQSDGSYHVAWGGPGRGGLHSLWLAAIDTDGRARLPREEAYVWSFGSLGDPFEAHASGESIWVVGARNGREIVWGLPGALPGMLARRAAPGVHAETVRATSDVIAWLAERDGQTRTIDSNTGRSVLYGRRTTCLPNYMERTAYFVTAWKLGHYYRTYDAYVEEEVRDALGPEGAFELGPITLFSRGRRDDDTPAFLVEDGPLLLWPLAGRRVCTRPPARPRAGDDYEHGAADHREASGGNHENQQ